VCLPLVDGRHEAEKLNSAQRRNFTSVKSPEPAA
jgi:hypothetical protein